MIWEICTNPSWCTPISTNTPKSITLRTVPFKIIPGFKSFISSTSLLKMGAGMFSLGSLDGFSSSFKISVRVISPMPSSCAISFLSLIFFSRVLTAALSFEIPLSFAVFCPPFCPFPFASSSKDMVIPPIAAASAFPIAVSVLRITIFCCLFPGSFFGAGLSFFSVPLFWAACF